MSDKADQNRKTAIRLMAAMDKSDEAVIREIIWPEAKWWVLGVGTMDLDTLIIQIKGMLGSARVAETTIIGTVAEDDKVAVESRGNFEFDDDRTYRNSYHHLFEFRDGRVSAIREYLDLRVTERAFGPIPAAD